MGHVVITMKVTVLPPPDSQALTAAHDVGEMTAEVTYIPPHTMTDAQVGNQVERIVRRLNKLADD